MQRKIRVLTVKGTPYEMGYAHGAAYRDEIREYAHDRIELVCSGTWSGHELPSAEVLALASQCVDAHADYAPDLFEEWRGMADATGLSLAELVVVGGFTDFVDVVYNTYRHKQTAIERLPVDDCTSFIVPDGVAHGSGYFGQTWDMHATAEPFVILLDVNPDNGPRSLVFTTTGCVGQIGMNEHGLAVGINNLLGTEGQIGVTWNFVIRKMLMQDNVDDALQCLKDANLAGAHNYLLFDRHGKGYNVEAMVSGMHITEVTESPFVHTNHCLIPEMNELAQTRPHDLMVSTVNRLDDGDDWLAQQPITTDHLIAMTRDPNAICQDGKNAKHVLTCGAAIMRPKTREMWAVWGVPSENAYERFTV